VLPDRPILSRHDIWYMTFDCEATPVITLTQQQNIPASPNAFVHLLMITEHRRNSPYSTQHSKNHRCWWNNLSLWPKYLNKITSCCLPVSIPTHNAFQQVGLAVNVIGSHTGCTSARTDDHSSQWMSVKLWTVCITSVLQVFAAFELGTGPTHGQTDRRQHVSKLLHSEHNNTMSICRQLTGMNLSRWLWKDSRHVEPLAQRSVGSWMPPVRV